MTAWVPAERYGAVLPFRRAPYRAIRLWSEPETGRWACYVGLGGGAAARDRSHPVYWVNDHRSAIEMARMLSISLGLPFAPPPPARGDGSAA